MPFNRSIARFLNVIMVTSFLIIIFFPLLDEGFGLHLDKSENTEKRILASRPNFSLESIEVFPSRYENYYNDNFSFRNSLVRLNSGITSKAYDLSAIPDVLIGKEGWLYYISKSQGNSREDYMGRLRVENFTLDSIKKKLERRSNYLNSRGIKFLVAVAPDKHSVYPDFIPSNVGKKGKFQTRLNQITNYLKANSSVQILDLRDALVDSRKTEPLPTFKKTDTHWNYLGGFIAYQRIMEALNMVPKSKTDFKWDQQGPGEGLDLAGMLGASEEFKELNEVTFTPLFKNDLVVNEIKEYEKPLLGKVLRVFNNDQSLPKLLMFHDSFGGAILPFLPHHFRESVFVTESAVFVTDLYSTAVIEKEKPDVVIMEMVERYADQTLSKGN
ncbi:MAG: hypothetical protein WDN75_12995 [Bacteroidota bacterium]